ncbi:hypothetical protein O6H91_14G009800 [Diphasiastrum complanatum]|uniref:Uncharacterized protein n=1 Tax=Diphasiastrum complanatum TaxID=34168 RepID=A0ACC2BLH5_DIPCM|nr:hypothetical protein O6H91_14G009800 [Diphasiastrum complanatum]
MQINTRNYAAEAAAATLPREPCNGHPFSSFVAHGQKGSSSGGGKHPPTLNKFSSHEDEESDYNKRAFDDPLGVSSLQPIISTDGEIHRMSRSSRFPVQGTVDEQANAANSRWSAYKSSVMQRFTSSGTIIVSVNFDIVSKEPKGKGKSVIAAHLEELEDPDKGAREELKIISQQDYVTRLRELNGEITQAWLNNERVAALRLTVKVAKLLLDTSVPQFYPTLFVLVTDVMDTVGNLVWERIKKKAETDESSNCIGSLPVNFTADDVRQEAKDTCNNWFHKIGSIRELLPRIYLEIAILRCVHFLEKSPLPTFQRLMMMARGLGDPLASAYVRLYLARRGLAMIPLESDYLVSGLKDYLVLFRRVLSGDFDKSIFIAGIQRQLHFSLVEPVIEWIMQCIFMQADQEAIVSLVETFNQWNHQGFHDKLGIESECYLVSSVLHYLLKELPSTFVGNNALKLSKMVKSCKDSSMSQHLNYILLGTKLCQCNSPRELRLLVLNDIWKVVTEFSSLLEYLAVADVFIEYALQCCSDNELKVMLHDIIVHVRKSNVNDEALSFLESIIFKLVTYYVDLAQVLTLDHFVEILDVFYGDIQKRVYKHVLSMVSRSYDTIKDPVTRNFSFEVSRVLHDSLDSLSSDDDRRQITRMISRFVQLVDFGRDVEQHLTFLVDCRSKFANMDPVREVVVHASNRLAATTFQGSKSFHNRGTIDFVKACITFNEITIPSINNAFVRLHLYVETAEVALLNALFSHTEGLLKIAITSLQDIQVENDVKSGESEDVISFLRKLLAFLIVVPGNSGFGALYLLRGISNLIENEQWLANGWHKVRAFCGILSTTTALAQEQLPYHVANDHVSSNDELFFGDTAYQEDIASTANFIAEKILHALDEIDDSEQKGHQLLEVSSTFLQAFSVSFLICDEIKKRCTMLIRTAASMLALNNEFLLSTIAFASTKGVEISLSG